jgi:hypothetical protein
MNIDNVRTVHFSVAFSEVFEYVRCAYEYLCFRHFYGIYVLCRKLALSSPLEWICFY